MRESIGGLVGDIKYAAGNGNILQFNTNMTFKMTYPSPSNVTGKYEVINVFPGNNRNLLH
ncbi:MAG TPA: hypothetical protein VK787_13080 [Puia sp.]|nr:hypothetical protein [Puia sp.]